MVEESSEEGKIDIHEIITKLYNIHLNTFIARYHSSKILSRRYTGGFRDVIVRNTSSYQMYCNWLEQYRTELFLTFHEQRITFNQLKVAFNPLIGFYAGVYIFEDKNRKELIKELLEPMKEFFDNLDKRFNTNFFNKKIESEINKACTLELGFFNKQNIPLENLTIFIINQEDNSKFNGGAVKTNVNYSYLIRKTDKLGQINVRLIKGTYKIKVPDYNYEEVIEITEDIILNRELKKKPKYNGLKIGEEDYYGVPGQSKGIARTLSWLIPFVTAVLSIILLLILFTTK